MVLVNEDEQHLLGEDGSDLDVPHGEDSASTAKAAAAASATAAAASACNRNSVVGFIAIMAAAALVIQWASGLQRTVPAAPNFLGLADTMIVEKAINATVSKKCVAKHNENCNEDKCCKDAGFECFEKNEWWASCHETCTPGIHPNDKYPHNTPWSCKKLTVGGKPDVADDCSESHENCMESRCCRDAGYKCYKKNGFWANCNATCSPGPHAWDSDKLTWDCSEVAEEPECSTEHENCMETGCCSKEGYTCFGKNDYWAKCAFECSPGETNILDPEEHRTPWTCDIIEMPCNESATPAELLACCKSFACEGFVDVELCALDKCGFYAAALLNASAAPLAMNSTTAMPTAADSGTTTKQTRY
jgi:hypothetical protein